MALETYILLIVFVPVVGSFILPLAGRTSPLLRNILALALVVVPLAASVGALSLPQKNIPFLFGPAMPLGMNMTFCMDGLAIFMRSFQPW